MGPDVSVDLQAAKKQDERSAGNGPWPRPDSCTFSSLAPFQILFKEQETKKD